MDNGKLNIVENIPTELEAFDGWTEDPTDEEVDELILAKKDFSYDKSSDKN